VGAEEGGAERSSECVVEEDSSGRLEEEFVGCGVCEVAIEESFGERGVDS